MELELHQLELKYARLRIFEPGRQARLLASLSEQGQRGPVLVVRAAGPDRYVLIDGYRRVAGLARLGMDVVEAVVLEMSEAEALIYDHRQGCRPRRSAIEDGWLIKELVEQCGLSMQEVAVRLGRSKSWVSRRLGLVEVLPETMLELVRSGQICAHAAAKYLVPLARANAGSCERLACGIRGQRLSARQVRDLYVGWRVADEEERLRIEQEPLLYLKAVAEVGLARPEDEQDKKRREMLLDLDALVGICRRAGRRMQAGVEGVAHPGYRGKLSRGWRQARLAFEELGERMEEAIDAGRGHEDGGVAAQG